ncbi:CARDB domain-containing protein [Halorussus amylolyticus]|uniref:CARDB domain-containing protein n=1 Tax=Halorussus amylolyticus TaxID=1126242 RepID=UPI0010453F99|nr:CARDB domain-containing protein [Halorussus amylolyticus]
MASVSSTHLILFIASLLIAASVAGTFTQGVQRLSSALGERSLDVSQDVRTDVEIISDPGGDAMYDSESENLTVLVKNTGSESLDADASQIDVLVDGEYQTGVSVNVIGGSAWTPGNVVEVEVDLLEPLTGSDHRVKVIVNNDHEVLQFRT